MFDTHSNEQTIYIKNKKYKNEVQISRLGQFKCIWSTFFEPKISSRKITLNTQQNLE